MPASDPRRTSQPRALLRRLFRADRAEVGVGTLIIFIAMVLVAAVAAAVIIGTTGTLQQRASETGKEATEDVASNFHIVGFFGVRNGTSSDIYTLKAYVELASGAKEVDLSSLVVRYSDGTNVAVYGYNATNPFTLTWLRGSNINNVIKANDLVEVTWNLASPLAPRSEIEIHFIPEKGSPVQLGARLPATYGTQTTITLR